MLKQVSSVAFLILASIILLAHDVVPHHHHDEHICFEAHSCEGGHSDDQSDAPEPAQDAKEACCLLAEMLVFTHASQHDEISCSCCSHDHKTGKFDAGYTEPDSFVGLYLRNQLPFRQNPLVSTPLLCAAGLSHGLRAPPLA